MKPTMPRKPNEESEWTTIRVKRDLHLRIQSIGRELQSKTMDETIEKMYQSYVKESQGG